MKETTSIPILIDALERSTNQNSRNEIVKALGEFWPNTEAYQPIIELLSNGSGGWTDRGEQVSAFMALARHDPDYLLNHAIEVYGLGGLEPSTKQALCHWIGQVAHDLNWNEELLIVLMENLISDQDSWIREQAAQALVRLRNDLCRNVFGKLIDSNDPWKTTCAVRALGYWSRDREEISFYRNSLDPLIRDAGDHSFQMMRKRQCLESSIENLGSSVDTERLAAFVGLEEHGDESTIWQLYDRYPDTTSLDVYVDSIQHSINKRRRDEHRKLGNYSVDRFDEVETITFD